ncbi:MAG TPA: hypothetical protein K8W06_02190 [Limosilactobacillus coleohominis]|nr:hypothetical protein [Limosilactobacillus coleohominis]
MSAMNDLDLKLKELDEQFDRQAEAAEQGHQLVQAIRQQVSGNSEPQTTDEHPKRDPVQDKVTVRQMLAEKCKEGYTDQIKDLLQEFGAEKLSDVDPKDYENLYYSAEAIGQ